MTAPPPPAETRCLRYDAAAVAEGAALIAAGEVVAVATETVYGLAADATDPHAVARIYAAKGRPSFNPLIVHVFDLATARRIARFDADALVLARAVWPGPLTLVLPLREGGGIASLATAGLASVAVRVPAHRAMRALLAACGRPLAAPSANASGGISPTRAAHVVASLGGRIPLVIDDGATEAGVESTILLGRTVLRPGPVTAERIAALLRAPGAGGNDDEKGTDGRDLDIGDADRVSAGGATAGTQPAGYPGGGHRPVAPGQLSSHYAPAKPLRLNATVAAVREYHIGFGPVGGTATLSARGDLTEAAANLFDALHRADASDRPAIAVAPVPATGIGIAINDRLARAAHRD